MKLSASQCRTLCGYGVAAAAVGLTLLTRLVFPAVAQAVSPFLLFTPAVMLGAWYGGLGPGLLATALGAVIGASRFSAGAEAFSPEISADRTIVFILVGMQISWLSDRLRAARRRAERDAEEARRSERIYRTLATNFPDGFVCLFDASLKWTMVAGSGMEAAGLAREPLEGKGMGETIGEETAATLAPLFRGAIEGRAASADVRLHGRVYAAHVMPLAGEGAGGQAGMAIFEDMTERVKARDALQQAHDTLEQRVAERTAELHFQKTLLESQSEAAPEGILALSQEGKVIFANARFLESWGLGALIRDAGQLRQHMESQLAQQVEALASGQGAEAATEALLMSDGRTMEQYSAPIADGEGRTFGRVWFFRDITERQRLQRQSVEASERERQRIGQDLHDDLCQQLTGIACAGRLLEGRLEATGRGEEAAAAERIVQMVQQANQRARDLARGLQPVQLQRDGLAAALQELAITTSGMFGIACEFRADEQAPAVSAGDAVHLYRIAQEAISNAVRHGRASRVLMDLLAAADRVILSIEDNGCGLGERRSSNGLGLHTMNDRARMMRGTLTLERAQPTGTIVTVVVPQQGGEQRGEQRGEGSGEGSGEREAVAGHATA